MLGRIAKAWRSSFLSTKLRGAEGAEIIEFAISLPLLMVFVVGIYDFGAAFALRQKLNSAVSEGVRTAANQPTRDLSATAACGAPGTVCAVRDVVANTLAASNVSNCGLVAVNSPTKSNLTWTFTSSAGCPGTLTLKIERGYTYTTTLSTPFPTTPYTIEATRITLTYPYQWQFASVFKILAPGANYFSSSLKSVAVMQNLN